VNIKIETTVTVTMDEKELELIVKVFAHISGSRPTLKKSKTD